MLYIHFVLIFPVTIANLLQLATVQYMYVDVSTTVYSVLPPTHTPRKAFHNTYTVHVDTLVPGGYPWHFMVYTFTCRTRKLFEFLKSCAKMFIAFLNFSLVIVLTIEPTTTTITIMTTTTTMVAVPAARCSLAGNGQWLLVWGVWRDCHNLEKRVISYHWEVTAAPSSHPHQANESINNYKPTTTHLGHQFRLSKVRWLSSFVHSPHRVHTYHLLIRNTGSPFLTLAVCLSVLKFNVCLPCCLRYNTVQLFIDTHGFAKITK